MEQLVKSSAAYALFCNDVKRGKPSHAYLLHFPDGANLSSALKIFALKFFGFSADSPEGRRLLNGTYTDCPSYPEGEGKLTVDTAVQIIADSALKPVEGDKKLYLIRNFEQASAQVQNKFLKTLEEPPAGVHFLLGATTLSPLLDTVKSRVKTLTLPPFSPGQIYAALERKGHNPLNARAAESCGGILGTAESMVQGGWFKEISEGALELCCADTREKAGKAAVEYGDTKYKNELLTEMQRLYKQALDQRICGGEYGKVAKIWQTPALIYALESMPKAAADVKFNAYFQGLLYDLTLRIIEVNEKWLKLRA